MTRVQVTRKRGRTWGIN